MQEGKRKIPDYEGDLYRQDYAPGIAELLRELSDLNERTMLDCIKAGFVLQGDFPKRLSVMLSDNLKAVVRRVFELGGLSQLSLRAMREAATYPPVRQVGQ